ncbi:slipin family protein [Streptomyces sp. NPDC006879]|uniref:slipin family protein n=1 Tax=Streptomyces sp. NPDC006879 TaxID=3364767 RepID=UPI0036BCC7AB
MVQELLTALALAGTAGLLYVAAAARVVRQYERGVVLRFGRLRGNVRGPGFAMIVPGVDRMHKVNMQIVTMPVPAQDGITRDNVTVRVDAVIYFKVVDPVDAIIRVEDYRFAVSQMAQTSLRSILGKSDLDELLSNREKLNQGLELMMDSPAVEWGVTIDRVEIKDVSLPETMKRSMARQAEANRERRARLINADAELQASRKLAEAAGVMSEQPAALQLRLLQTVVAVAAEKNSTLVLPFPVELLRFLERATPSQRITQEDAAHHGHAPSSPQRAGGGAEDLQDAQATGADALESLSLEAPATPAEQEFEPGVPTARPERSSA